MAVVRANIARLRLERPTALLLLSCALVCACATARKPSAANMLREVDPTLIRIHDVREFEARLAGLGAKIEAGATPDERIATAALPGKPGYFPPRTLRVVYVVTDKGRIMVRSAEVTSLGSRFAENDLTLDARERAHERILCSVDQP
jgi:hypothetical protein